MRLFYTAIFHFSFVRRGGSACLALYPQKGRFKAAFFGQIKVIKGQIKGQSRKSKALDMAKTRINTEFMRVLFWRRRGDLNYRDGVFSSFGA